MTVYTHHSARVRTQQRSDGVFIADYSGFFASHAWASLGRQTHLERMRSSVTVDRFYRAIHNPDDRLDQISLDCLPGSPTGVWVVSADQYATALRLSHRLAQMGVTRMVFLQAFEPVAMDFAAAQCLVSCR